MVDTDQSRTVRFGLFELDLRAGELRKNGVKIKLQEQPFRLLVILLQHPGDIVTREELREQLWPADTFVDFDHSLNAAVKRLRDALGESAESPVYIETLARRGYRFIPPIQAITPEPSPLDAFLRTSRKVRLRPRPEEADRAIGSLAVLPFANASADPQMDYLSDGLTESIILSLSQLPQLRVMSRSATAEAGSVGLGCPT